MRIITIVICIDYFAASFVFDGLNLSGDNFTSNLFLYIALSGLAEVPSYTLTVPIINRWGRRMPAVVFFLLCGIIVSVITFIPPGDLLYVCPNKSPVAVVMCCYRE